MEAPFGIIETSKGIDGVVNATSNQSIIGRKGSSFYGGRAPSLVEELDRLKRTNDNFGNDLINLHNILKLKSARSKKMAAICGKISVLFLIGTITMFELLINFIKGELSALQCLVNILLSMWLALYLFMFARQPI